MKTIIQAHVETLNELNVIAGVQLKKLWEELRSLPDTNFCDFPEGMLESCANGTGYFDSLVDKKSELGLGALYRGFDTHGRMVIACADAGYEYGHVSVFFERYVKVDGKDAIVLLQRKGGGAFVPHQGDAMHIYYRLAVMLYRHHLLTPQPRKR